MKFVLRQVLMDWRLDFFNDPYPHVLDADEEEDFHSLVMLVTFPRKARVFRQRIDAFSLYSDNEFIDRFRLSKDCVKFLVDRLRHRISSRTMRNRAVTVEECYLRSDITPLEISS